MAPPPVAAAPPQPVAPSPPEAVPLQGPKETAAGTGPSAGNGAILAATAATAAVVSGARGGAGSAPARVDLGGYYRGIYAALNGALKYPAIARRQGMEGRALVVVKIDRKGRLVTKPRISESTSYGPLDEAAVRLIEEHQPFPGVPAGYVGDTLEFTVPISFRLED